MTISSDNAGAMKFGGPIILVSDRSDAHSAAARALEVLGETRVVAPGEVAGVLATADVDLVIVDANGNGAAIAAEIATVRPHAVRLLLSDGADGHAHEPLDGTGTILAQRPAHPEHLVIVCTLALRCAAAERSARELGAENNRLRGIDSEPLPIDVLGGLEHYEGILTRSPAMKHVLGLLEKIEDSDTTVLIHGETGTGKELVAQAIHARSRCRKGRFVAVNLGAISDHLRESELFGHVRGAFTGATDNRRGLFVEADGGCIFLDEVGDASAGLQVALLRVLEEGTITPVGSDRPRAVDVRIISGTNRDLEALVRQGLFRRDLYYRLNVFPVDLPPLRDRAEDIFPLANHFLALASMAMGKKPLGISREARAVLESYHWEGNVRELRNVMERAAILCKGGLVIAADLPIGRDRRGANGTASANGGATIVIPPGGASLADLEREIFLRTLALTGGNQRRAARILGLRESTFRFRMRRLHIVCRRLREEGAQPTAKAQQAANA